MLKWLSAFRSRWHLEAGQTLVEYSLILGLVSVTLIGTLVILQESIDGLYRTILDAFP